MSYEPRLSEISPKEFSQRPFKEQVHILRMADSKKKCTYLFEVEHGAALMEELPIQDVYLLVKELGSEELTELMGLVSPEQWTGFFDLDCWRHDSFDTKRARTWLHLLLCSNDEHVFNTLLAINFELLVLIFKQEVLILAGPEDINDDDARLEAIQRNGGYQIAYRDEEGAKLFGNLLRLLFGYSEGFFRYLLNALRAETPSMIEENVFQQRADRMQEIGFCDPLTAHSVYSWLDPYAYRADKYSKQKFGLEDQGYAPSFILTIVKPKGLFADIAQTSLNETLAWELASLINKVALADRVDFSIQTQLKETISKVYETINLALEWLSGNNPEKARQILSNAYCEELFRLGFSLLLQLKKRAQELSAGPICNFWEESQHMFLRGLSQKFPVLYKVHGDTKRHFSKRLGSLHDLEKAKVFINDLEKLQQLFEQKLPFSLPEPDKLILENCLPNSIADISLGTFFLTAYANHLLGKLFSPNPVGEDELQKLHLIVSKGNNLKENLKQDICKWLDSLVDGTGKWGAYWLKTWSEEFCQVSPDDLDPRYLGGLIIRLK